MDIEENKNVSAKPKKLLPKAQQIRFIKRLVARDDIKFLAKSVILEDHFDINLDDALTFDLLEELKETDLIYYLEYPEEREKLIPPPKSASDWSDLELNYYSISIIKIDYGKMFGPDAVSLPAKIEKFLKFHTDEFLGRYASEKLKPNFSDFSDFGNLFVSYANKKKEESRVDNIVRYFIRKIFGKDFNVETQVTCKLKVNKAKCKAITDVSVSDATIEAANEVIVVEDKTLSNVTESLEAQLIAEGIAVTQQKKWKIPWPIYLITSTGLSLQFYKAVFSQKLLSNVEKGYDCGFVTEVLKLDHGLDIDLGREDGRRSAALLLYRIAEDCRSRRKK